MNHEMIIRRAEVGDAQRIYEINRDSLGYDFPLDRTQARLKFILSGSDRIFVACYQDEVIGYIHGSAYECTYCESLKNILALAVDPAYQGQCAGRMLLCALEDWARQDRSAGVRLVSGFSRRDAHQFYLHCGYMHRKDQKNFVKYF